MAIMNNTVIIAIFCLALLVGCADSKNAKAKKDVAAPKDSECSMIEGLPDLECEAKKKEKDKAGNIKSHNDKVVDGKSKSNNLKRLSSVWNKLDQLLSGDRGVKTNKKHKRGKGVDNKLEKSKNVRKAKDKGMHHNGSGGGKASTRRRPRRRGNGKMKSGIVGEEEIRHQLESKCNLGFDWSLLADDLEWELNCFQFASSKDFIRRMQKRQRRKKSQEIEDLETRIMNKTVRKDRNSLKGVLMSCSSMLRKIRIRERRRKLDILDSPGARKNATEEPSSFEVLSAMNTLGMSVAEDMGWSKDGRPKSMAVEVDDVALEVSNVNTENFVAVTFPSKELKGIINDSITFPEKLFAKAGQENGTIISSFYEAFEEMSSAAQNASRNSSYVNSRVISSEVIPPPVGELLQPVKLTFKHTIAMDASSSHSPVCAFWKYNSSDSTEGGWSSEGCRVYRWNSTHTECHCNHLTDFAILFRADESQGSLGSHKAVLSIISLIGCIFSVVALILTIGTLLCMRKLLRSERNLIHLNLAVALLVANVVFLVADTAQGKQTPCFIVTLLLFYFFLCAFAWMLVEGIQIWILLTHVFEGRSRIPIYHLVGWGAPLLVVAIAAGIYRFDLMGKQFCWLSTSSSAIWTFIGPCILIITVNLVVLIKALYLTYKHNQDKEDTSSIRTAARCCLVLMPILGFTWIFGIFSINGRLVVFQYLFTIFNSLQGLFIFIFYILLNVEVQREYRSIRRKQRDTQSVQQRLTHSTTTGPRSESHSDKKPLEIELIPNADVA